MDIVDEVFHGRLQALLNNLRRGKYFGGKKTTYLMHVIEYQNRGLPHAHIVFRLEGGPDHRDREACKQWIEEHICTTAYTPGPNASDEDKRYYEYVKPGGSMQHRCFRGCNGCLNEFGVCKRKYTDRKTTNDTSWDEKGYPIYKRPETKDRRIVPHNREILLDWDGHANLEFAATTFCIFYLYKYLFKGNRKLKIEINGINSDDEIQIFLKGRLLTSMDAMWRTFGYHTYPSSDPGVRVIKAKLPQAVLAIAQEKKLCDLFVYFKRPRILWNLNFTDFFNGYDYKYNLTANRFNPNDPASPTFYEIPESPQNKRFFIYPRLKPQKCLTRLSWVPPEIGELFYLRQMLSKFSYQSFEDILTVGNHICLTFQEAAKERGLVNDINDVVNTFREASTYYPPPGLRGLFVTLSIFGFPTHSLYASPETRYMMLADLFRSNTPQGHAEANEKLLEDLHDRFGREGKTLLDYGLPEPRVKKSVLEKEVEMMGTNEQNQAWLTQLHEECPLTSEMQNAYDSITHAIQHNEPGMYLIRGVGGSGKTQFAKKIFAFARSVGKIVKGCAATALAAQNFHEMDFETAHSLFNCPVIDDDESYDHINQVHCDTTKYPQKTELVNAASVILWDEIFSQDKLVFNAAQISYDWSTKVLVAFGDEGQIGPVVRYGSRSDLVAASIIKHRLWRNFQIYKFTKNLRLLAAEATINPDDAEAIGHLARQKKYAMVCELIRSGCVTDDHVQCLTNYLDSGESLLRLPMSRFYTDTEAALNYLFPDGFNTPGFEKRAILCATNELVSEWNFKVQCLNPNPPILLYARTRPKDHDDFNGELAEMLTEDVCCSYQDPSAPDHILTLKVGDLCLVTRTLSRKDHIANNTRVKILEIRPHTVKVQTVSENNPRYFALPRIHFTVKSNHGGFAITRTQFPLRLAYAVTYNKSQGQTIPVSLVDIRSMPFSHGHLYVSMSRADDVDSTAFYCDESQVVDGAVSVSNVVYPELLIP